MFLESFPNTRLRRLRQKQWIRDIFEETPLLPRDLIQPIFVIEGVNKLEPIASLPGINRMSVDMAVKHAEKAASAGVRCILLLPCIDDRLKTVRGEEALNSSGLLARATRAIKDATPDIGIMGDIALDLYTSHGHDGVFDANTSEIKNDETLELLVQQSLTQASFGVDILAPSDMMDGRVGAIRKALENNGYENILIFPHSAKYASALYGPYRDAARSGKNLGKRDKRTYQQNPSNTDEAIREVRIDITEGADAIIAKPAGLYLDVVHRISHLFHVPVVAFHVSGEYAMVKAASAQGLLDEHRVLDEVMVSIKRAGASAIITYAAIEIAERLKSR